MNTTSSELHRARRAAYWVGTIIPLALTLIGSVIVAFALPKLPAEVAIQFSFAGTPSNFGPAWTQLVLTLGIGALLSTLAFYATRSPNKTGEIWTKTHRFLPALMLGVVAMIEILGVGTTLLQVGLSNARDMPSPVPVMIAGLAAWPTLTVVGYLVQPKIVIDNLEAAASTPLPLAPGERVVWVGSTSLKQAAVIVIGLVITLTVAVALALLLLGNEYWWLPGLLAIILGVAAMLATVYRVRIDATGLTAKSPLGWPVFHVKANDVETVTVGDINPLGEFGGWGLRSTPDGFGLVLRTGTGIRIRRRNGRMFVITLDDAETAASVLMTAAARSHS